MPSLHRTTYSGSVPCLAKSVIFEHWFHVTVLEKVTVMVFFEWPPFCDDD